jgi:Mrp family chromosome partitioning ATPase
MNPTTTFWMMSIVMALRRLEPRVESTHASPSSTETGQPELPGISGLMTTLFASAHRPRVVAFVANRHGTGVTAVVRSLAATLDREMGWHTRIASAADVALPPRLPKERTGEDADTAADGSARLKRLRAEFDCVLIDCSPLETSSDVSRVASLVDGVVIMLEAGRTRKAQVERAVSSITSAGGRCLGLVLNKREYPIPRWLYRLLT